MINDSIEVRKHFRNLLQLTEKPVWNAREIVLTSSCLIETGCRLLLQQHMAVKGLAWPMPTPLPMTMAGHLIKMLKNWDVLASLRVTAIDYEDLFVLNDVRARVAAHDSDPVDVTVALRCLGVSLILLAQLPGVDECIILSDIAQAHSTSTATEKEPECRFSTGAAVEMIGKNIAERITLGEIASMSEMIRASYKNAEIVRGAMIGFRHFVKIGNEYPLRKIDHTDAIVSYIQAYIRHISECNNTIGKVFCDYLLTHRHAQAQTICISEYSRAAFAGIMRRLLTNDPLIVYLVSRSTKAEVPQEIRAAETKLHNHGAHIAAVLNEEEWITFLEELNAGQKSVEMIVFGAEALTHVGDIVFPQIISQEEIGLLSRLASKPIVECHVDLVCVAESYKVLPAEAIHEARAMPNRGMYSIIPSTAFRKLISDLGVFDLREDVTSAMRRLLNYSVDRSREFIMSCLAEERMMPLDYLPESLVKKVRFLASDIDDTITINGKLPGEVVRQIASLRSSGIKIVLITGRSAGWAQALTHYLECDFVIAENGIVLFDKRGEIRLLSQVATDDLRPLLSESAAKLKTLFGLEETEDSRFRLCDITFQRPADLRTQELAELNSIINDELEVIASSIHIHLRPKGIQKSDALKMLLKEQGVVDFNTVMVVGDSATDQSLFRDFPLSVGVANVLAFQDELQGALPRFITNSKEASGFAEVVSRLLCVSHS